MSCGDQEVAAAFVPPDEDDEDPDDDVPEDPDDEEPEDEPDEDPDDEAEDVDDEPEDGESLFAGVVGEDESEPFAFSAVTEPARESLR